MLHDTKIEESLNNLEKYIKNQHYSGFDPYDALDSPVLEQLNNRITKILFTQLLVYSPINAREFLKIKPEINPKSLGLLLSGYCRLYKLKIIKKEKFERIYKEIVELLISKYSKGYSGKCWGFNFNWQDWKRYAKKDLPTIVVTSYVAQSFLDLYEITKKSNYLDIARSSCDFINNDLHITRYNEGICFSYTPIDETIVHNANALGAALLARVHAYTKEEVLYEKYTSAFDFLVSYQRNNGSWAYSMNPKTKKERNQIDFHQGFILDSLYEYAKYDQLENNKIMKALELGAMFYEQQQFNSAGKSKWRLPFEWPVDIHHQAQGIITFSKMFEIFEKSEYLDFSKKIAYWTINNMFDTKGFFYYQKWPIIMNRISYMRWGQAWMFLAFSDHLIRSQKENL